jgi:hypothetical protein
MAFDISNIDTEWFSAGLSGYQMIRYRKRDVRKYFFSSDGTDLLTIIFYGDEEQSIYSLLSGLTLNSATPVNLGAAIATLDVIIGGAYVAPPPVLLPEYPSSTEATADGLDTGEYFRTGEFVKQVLPVILP